MTVADVCTRSVVTATPDETVADAASRMRDHHVGTVVVVDGEKRDRPTGILADRDIVVGAVAQSPDNRIKRHGCPDHNLPVIPIVAPVQPADTAFSQNGTCYDH